jgi:hypothetical protein
MDWVDVYIDAPVTLKIRFCECEREISDDFDDYHGTLSRSWLEEDTVNIDFPGLYKMPRRYAARFVKITVICARRKLTLRDFCFRAQTSADQKNLEKVKFEDEKLELIDKIAVNTLKNCMQRVFEDGPKRDRRLWIGDLRLEALTNYETFKSYALTRRCLYLFAAADTDEFGIMPGYVYENPFFVSGSWFIRDYALLFATALCDYVDNTGDMEVFSDLYPVARAQIDAVSASLDADGIVSVNTEKDYFIDWCAPLKKLTSLHGVYCYTLKRMAKTLAKIGHKDANHFAQRWESAKNAAFEHLYSKEEKTFANSRDEYQKSVHSVAWMILGGVIEGSDALEMLDRAVSEENYVKPFTPYMHHYVAEAYESVGATDKALDYVKGFWGKMADMGADTFFEVFVPSDPDFSPYNDRKLNSMCHAWSCTPSYFIRKYGKKIKKL